MPPSKKARTDGEAAFAKMEDVATQYVAWDTNMITQRLGYDDALTATIEIYLDPFWLVLVYPLELIERCAGAAERCWNDFARVHGHAEGEALTV